MRNELNPCIACRTHHTAHTEQQRIKYVTATIVRSLRFVSHFIVSSRDIIRRSSSPFMQYNFQIIISSPVELCQRHRRRHRLSPNIFVKNIIFSRRMCLLYCLTLRNASIISITRTVFVFVQCLIVFSETPSAFRVLVCAAATFCWTTRSATTEHRTHHDRNATERDGRKIIIVRKMWMVLCVPAAVPSVVAYLLTQYFQFCRKRVKNKLILFDDNETNLLSVCAVCAPDAKTLLFFGPKITRRRSVQPCAFVFAIGGHRREIVILTAKPVVLAANGFPPTREI